MLFFQRDQIALRLIAPIVSFPIVAFVSHLLIYAIPKRLEESYPDLVPLSYDYWDRGNMLTSMILSSLVGLVVGYLLFKPKAYPNGTCPACGYDMRGATGDPPYTCPECGHLCE